MEIPRIFEERAAALSRVPSHPGQTANVATRSTNARTWGCRESTSLDSIDFWIFGIRPS